MPAGRVVVAVVPPTTVALRAAGLGDLLTAVPALRALRRCTERGRVVVAAPQGLHPLVALMGDVDAVAHAGLDPVRLESRPSLAVNLHGSGPQSHQALLSTQPRTLWSYVHRAVPASGAGPMWRDDDHEVARWCRLLEWFGVRTDRTDLRLRRPAAPTDRWQGVTVVHPGAAAAARRWPVARWAAVVRHEARAGRRVVVTGGPDEVSLGQRVAEGARERVAVIAGRTRLVDLVTVVAHAGRVVCGDTGVAHLATAFGVPSVVLFGPTSPDRWGPPSACGRHRTLWAGRLGDPNAGVVDPGLLEISVSDVVAALGELDGAPLSRRRDEPVVNPA